MSGHVQDEILLIARPTASLREALEAELHAHGLADALERWPSSNWHQSLSQKHPMTARLAVASAMASLTAVSFEMVINRVVSQNDQWHLRMHGNPPAFAALLSSLRSVLSREGIDDPGAHRPHITLSYHAPRPLHGSVAIRPISGQVTEIELVQAGGEPYRYTTLERWALAPPSQADLF